MNLPVPLRVALVGLIGSPGSGRRTVASHLAARHGFQRVVLEAPVRDAAALLFDISPFHYASASIERAPLRPGGPSPRELTDALRSAAEAFRGPFLPELGAPGVEMLMRARTGVVIEDVCCDGGAALVRRLGGELWVADAGWEDRAGFSLWARSVADRELRTGGDSRATLAHVDELLRTY
jgi:hypothetical protein